MGRPRKNRAPGATCHPGREEFVDGLCGVCYYDMKRLAENERPPANALELYQKHKLTKLHEDVKRIEALLLSAKAIVRENMPRYAELHMIATEVAASKGDARPAEWALSSVKGEKGERAVEPPKAEASAGAGVKVIIGVQMGCLPTTGGTAEVIDASNQEDEHGR
jgi:hypothetical protein